VVDLWRNLTISLTSLENYKLSLQKRDKKPSKQLVSVIRQSAKVLVNFAELWKRVQDKGYAEGFDEKELQQMVRPILNRG
jgi:hypothetical protein